MIINFLKSIAILFFIMVFISCKENKRPFKSVTSFLDIETKKIEVYVGGEGANTIVFESGLGVDGKTWLESGIFDSLGSDNQVIAYNRSGYLKSTENSEKRGIPELVNDLHVVITKKSKNGKVVLVGHSLGGAIARAYAVKYPDKVKALLLIEPTNENFKQYALMSQEHEDMLVKQFTIEKLNGAANECSQLIENREFLKKLSSLPNIPVTVITSTKTDSEMTPENVSDWIKAHHSLGNGVTKFTHITTNKSGHFVYTEEPNLVVENINRLLR